MAELSLKEEIAEILEEHFDTRCLEELPNGEFKPVNLTDKATKDIINLMLAKVDKALLTEKQIAEINKSINNYDSAVFEEWLKNEDTKLNYRDWRIAKAQLQAIKSILEGK